MIPPWHRRGVPTAAITAAALLAVIPRSAHACAGCRNPNLPSARLGATSLAPGEIRASLAVSATALRVVHDAGCADVDACTEVPVQPLFRHDQGIFPVELRVIGEVGVTRAWGVEAHVPFRLVVTTIRYTTPDGAPYEPLDSGVHHRDETLAGIGDPWLLARAGTWLGAWLTQVRLGTSIPLGRTEDDPFALGAMGKRHQHIQLGTGTFDPTAALDVTGRLGPVSLSAYVQGQASLYENARGFRAGARLLSGVQVARGFAPGWIASASLDGMHDGPERWQGEIQQDGLLGRRELLAGLGVSYARDVHTVSLAVRVPIYRRVIVGAASPGRLSSPAVIGLAYSRAFRGAR